jgi:hypothetical protein
MRWVLLSALVILTACTQAAQDQIARDAARASATKVLAEKFPGVPLQPAADCVIDNASSGQILSLAADSITGPTANTDKIVTNIVSKPETLTCLAAQGLPALLR